MRYTITKMFDGKWWVTSHKEHLGWSTLDGVYATLEEAESDCDKAGGGYRVQGWHESGWFTPVSENDYASYREKEIAYDYLG